MLSPLNICWCCDDEYSPVEYSPGSIDPDEPEFCSDGCAEAWAAAEDATEAYEGARYSAPVFGP